MPVVPPVTTATLPCPRRDMRSSSTLRSIIIEGDSSQRASLQKDYKCMSGLALEI